MKRYDEDGCRLTDCCGVYSKFMDNGNGTESLCCRKCKMRVSSGEGDGSERLSKAQMLLQGKKIVGVDDDNANQLILMLEDGTNIVIESCSRYVGNGVAIPIVRVARSVDPTLDTVDAGWAD